MNSSTYVNQKIAEIKFSEKPIVDCIWETAQLCIGWPYIFGDRGQYCTPDHRKSKDLNKYPAIRTKCQVLNGNKSSCTGCKWYPDGQKVRAFDCRGFPYWCLLQFGIKINGAGATSQWNDKNNWEEKGTINSVPEDKLVCLFYTNKSDPKIMEHTGFGYRGETIECSNGVQHFKTRNKKWTHWAVPKGLYTEKASVESPKEPSVDDDFLPTLRKGDKGPYVTLLQTMLLNHWYYLPKYGADGDFGEETLSAVKQFQQDWDLQVDGIVGPETWSYLKSVPEHQKLYTVNIPHRTQDQGEELLKQYPGTMTLEK